MDDVAVDQRMEMSSDIHPFHENPDDIEIDLDVIHDANEDRDGDVQVDDASDHGASLSGVQYFSHDADMVDEEYAAEHGASLEFDYQQRNHYQYAGDDHQDETYEAEMEDDYEEDIDAPIPDTGSTEQDDVLEVELQPTETQPPQRHESPTRLPSPKRTTPAGIPTPEPAPASEADGDDNNQPHPTEDFSQELHTTDYQHTDEDGEGREYKPDNEAEEELAKEGGHVEVQDGSYDGAEEIQSTDTSAPTAHAAGQPNEDVILHNVKIFYQDSEMSLFPPMEDDPSETYFLEDVSLVHEPIRDLLHACRVVLNDHIGEDEELMLDIDSLDLHLSENVSKYPNISLFQICQAYHNLCLNDGVESPDPLYLSLTSRNSFDSVFNGLMHAVEEGRGLSAINKWDDFGAEEEGGAAPKAGKDEEETGQTRSVEGREVQDRGVSAEEFVETESKPPGHAVEQVASNPPDDGKQHGPTSQDSGLFAGDSGTSPTGQPKEVIASEVPVTTASHDEPDPSNIPITQDEGLYTEEYHEQEEADENTGTNHFDEVAETEQPATSWNEPSAAEHFPIPTPQGDDYSNTHQDVQEPASLDSQEVYSENAEPPQDYDFQSETLSAGSNGVSAAHERSVETRDFATSEQQWYPQMNDSERRQDMSYGAFEASGDTGEGYHDPEGDDYPSDGDRGADESVVIHAGGYESTESNFGETEIDVSADYDENGFQLETAGANEELQPGTPEAPHDLFDIEEDIFKSPMPNAKSIPVSAQDPEEDHAPLSRESGEVTPTQSRTSRLQPEISFTETSPSPVKRSRPDDDINLAEDEAHGVKRRRSE